MPTLCRVRVLLPAPVYRRALSIYRWLPGLLRRWIMRMLTPRYSAGVLCVLRRDGRILMLRQRHHAGWTLPGGLLSRGEVPRTALQRELREELDIDVIDLPTEPAHTWVHPLSRHIDLVFVVNVDADVDPQLTPDAVEVLNADWRPADADPGNVITANVLRLLSSPTTTTGHLSQPRPRPSR